MRVVVIGAAGGIGSALTRRLAARQAEIVACGRTPETLEKLADETNAIPVVVDARDPDSLERALTNFQPVDAIVNCAGSILLKPAHRTSLSEWKETLETNLTTAFAAVRAGVQVMNPAGGSIVLCSTAAARVGLANHEAIAAAKAGVIGLTLSAAATYSARNIRVNCVAPGLVDTPLSARITANPAALNVSRSLHALGRIGQAEEVAAAIAWLLEPLSSWITGQVIGVDGGLATVRGKA
ncbi:MAG: SDR family oxidoreductase [Bryobacteraceae bacterium]|nr:SDR family oxidoreductase [Bryobacteraceae bacterium]MDW8378447.1 SDR family oxidoreductase [Bryobacterales bacterium]